MAGELFRTFNGVFGSSRDASVYGDGAKSKSLGRRAQALGQMNSLCTAIEFEADDRFHYWYRYCHWRCHFP